MALPPGKYQRRKQYPAKPEDYSITATDDMLQHVSLPPGHPLPLFGQSATRAIEQRAMAGLPAHTLMQRAAQAVTRLSQALYPHARHLWFACGPGNNGGDGLLAAAELQWHLRHTGGQVSVTWLGTEDRLPQDARYALTQARAANVRFVPAPPAQIDLAIDALLGIGAHNAAEGPLGATLTHLQSLDAPVLCVDLPSGLGSDTGHWPHPCPARSPGPRHTLSLLTLKPGLFTASGRDAAGDIWFDDLDIDNRSDNPDAWLYAPQLHPTGRSQRHAAHKGSHGDLIVIGGQDVHFNGQGMTGAALLAARAGLQGGAGRVFVGLVGGKKTHQMSVDPLWPDLMFRDAGELAQGPLCDNATVVCGCGGGDAVREWLPTLLQRAPRLVLDADALNALADTPALPPELRARAARGQRTILTPHPLEAARLLRLTSPDIQHDRLRAARQLADQWQCGLVLKGSGSVVTAPGGSPMINPSGNALLATGGTGDVLAGLIGAYWCTAQTSSQWENVVSVAADAVWSHGRAADTWPATHALTAHALVNALAPQGS